MNRVRAFLFLGLIVGLVAYLFGTESGRRTRQQLVGATSELPSAVNGILEMVDVDEIVGTLANAALDELKPSLTSIFKR